MDCGRYTVASRGLSLLTRAYRGLLLLLAGAALLLLQVAAGFWPGWIAAGLSAGELSMRALDVCETGGVEYPAECAPGAVLSASLLGTRAQPKYRTSINLG